MFSLSFSMIKYILLIFIVLIFVIPGLSQSKIYLQHKTKPDRQKKLSMKRDYTFQTYDTTYYKYRILAFTDSTLMIGKLFSGDTVLISMFDITCLTMNKKVGFFEVTAYLGCILLTISPIVWAFEGGEAALGTLEGAGLLAAFSIPVLLLKEVGRKKDTKIKWYFRTG